MIRYITFMMWHLFPFTISILYGMVLSTGNHHLSHVSTIFIPNLTAAQMEFLHHLSPTLLNNDGLDMINMIELTFLKTCNFLQLLNPSVSFTTLSIRF